MFKRVPAAPFVAVILVVAACGGASPGSPTPGRGGGGAPASTGPAAGGGAAASPAGTAAPGGAAAAGTLDPCSLLTQGEVAAATGEPVGPGQSQNDGKQCMWEYSDPKDQLSGLDASLSVDLDPEVWREEQGGNALSTPVSGVGDEAYFTAGGIAGVLDFRKGSQLFEVGMNVAGTVKDKLPSAAQEAAEKQMALAALARIP